MDERGRVAGREVGAGRVEWSEKGREREGRGGGGREGTRVRKGKTMQQGGRARSKR